MTTKILIGKNVRITKQLATIKIDTDQDREAFTASQFRYDSLYISAISGYVSLGAMKFLSDLGVTVQFSNISGRCISQIVPQTGENHNPNMKIRQYQAYLDQTRKTQIAKELILEKHKRANETLKAFGLPTLDCKLPEATFAQAYFDLLSGVFHRFGYDYETRKGRNKTINKNAVSYINASLNLLYGFAEGRLLREIELSGLDYQIAFNHKWAPGKISLTYDLIELLRASIDAVILTMAQNKELKEKDFRLIDESYFSMKPIAIPRYISALEKFDFAEPVRWLTSKL